MPELTDYENANPDTMMELARMGENPILVDDLNFEDENIVELDF